MSVKPATGQRHVTVAEPCRRCGIDVRPGRDLCGDCAGFDPAVVYDKTVLANRRRVKAYYWRNREAVMAKQRARNAQRTAAQRARRMAS